MLVIIIMVNRCEDVELALPGNNQDNPSVAPAGAIIWDENNVIMEDGKAIFPENSAAGVTIGRLNATDENPDDEFNYQIKSQKVDDIDVNHFIIDKDSESNYDLETNNNILDYEALAGSKSIIIAITVTDDNPDQKTSDFDIKIEITNVNEAPYWKNENGQELTNYQPSITADIEIPFESMLYWDDEDYNQNPTLISSDQKPEWLIITTTGTTAELTGTPHNVETGSFLLTISDGEFDFPVDMNFEVRSNQKPKFTSFSPNHSFRVGCNQQGDEIIEYQARDSNNNSSLFNGGDEYDLLTVGYTEEIGWLAIDISNNTSKTPNVKLRCIATPSNDDAQNGGQQLTFSITDNRVSIPQDTTYQLTMEVLENSEPEFANTDALPDTIQSDTTTVWTVEWVDADEDLIILSIENPPSWLEYDVSTGIITATPDSINNGSYEFEYTINEDNDGCFSETFPHSLTVE